MKELYYKGNCDGEQRSPYSCIAATGASTAAAAAASPAGRHCRICWSCSSQAFAVAEVLSTAAVLSGSLARYKQIAPDSASAASELPLSAQLPL